MDHVRPILFGERNQLAAARVRADAGVREQRQREQAGDFAVAGKQTVKHRAGRIASSASSDALKLGAGLAM